MESQRQFEVQVRAIYGEREFLVADVKTRESDVDQAIREFRREFPEPNYTITSWPLVFVTSRREITESQVIGVYESEMDAVVAMWLAKVESEDEAIVTALALR